MSKKTEQKTTNTNTNSGSGWEDFKEPPTWPLREGAVIVGVYTGEVDMPEGKWGPWSCAQIKLTQPAACVVGIGDAAQDYEAKPGETVLVPIKANFRRILRAFKPNTTELRVEVIGKSGTGDGDNEAWSFAVKSRAVKGKA